MTSIYTSFMCADIVKQGDEIISVGQLNQQAKKLLETHQNVRAAINAHKHG